MFPERRNILLAKFLTEILVKKGISKGQYSVGCTDTITCELAFIEFFVERLRKLLYTYNLVDVTGSWLYIYGMLNTVVATEFSRIPKLGSWVRIQFGTCVQFWELWICVSICRENPWGGPTPVRVIPPVYSKEDSEVQKPGNLGTHWSVVIPI
jgi:hypothetical protein